MPDVESAARLGETRTIPRAFEFLLFVVALLWAMAASVIAGRAGQGIAGRFGLGAGESLLSALFLVFLVVVGLRLLDAIATRGVNRREVFPLPARAGWTGEFGLGAAVGWGLCLAAVLPVLLSRNLHAHLLLGGRSLLSVLGALATLLAVTLAEELIVRGYALRRLMAAVGPSWAAIGTSLGFSVALVLGGVPRHLLAALAAGFAFGLVLALAYLRTHALWISWGIHFAYRALMAVAFGLPIAGHGELASVADSYMTGPTWLTGGAFGLDSTWLTAIVLCCGFAILFPLTREYAWRYTHREIVAGGYEVTVAPPAAHTAMEQQAAAKPAPLVQILSATPHSRSVISPPLPPVEN